MLYLFIKIIIINIFINIFPYYLISRGSVKTFGPLQTLFGLPRNPSDSTGTLPVHSLSLYFHYSDKSKTISKRRQELKCVALRFGKYSRHGRDPSLANDRQGDLDGYDGPCTFQNNRR